MKLVIVTFVPVVGAGGMECLVRGLVQHFVAEHAVALFSPDRAELLASCAPLRGLAEHRTLPRQPNRETCALIQDGLRAFGADLCHFHLSGSFDGFEEGGVRSCVRIVAEGPIPVLTTNHQATTPFDLNRTREFLPRRLLGFAKRWPEKRRQLLAGSCEVMVSDHDLNAAARCFPGCRQKLTRIYHSRMSELPRLGELASTKTLLCLATLGFRKGQHILVDAFARLASDFPDWKLRLVGRRMDSNYVSSLEGRVAELGLGERISMPGETSEPDFELSQAEILIQPSLLEGLGLSVQEALGHGLPIVASRVGGVPELIAGTDGGRLVEPGSVEDLEASLRELMSNRALREQMGQVARQSVVQLEMTEGKMFRDYQLLYHQAVESSI